MWKMAPDGFEALVMMSEQSCTESSGWMGGCSV